MDYMTRRLLALKDIPHGDRFVRNGEAFGCTPIDADYYLTRKFAADAKAAPGTVVRSAVSPVFGGEIGQAMDEGRPDAEHAAAEEVAKQAADPVELASESATPARVTRRRASR